MPRPGQLLAGEALRWYLTRARHPLKDYIVGHYWRWFERRQVWIRYDGDGAIHVRLGDYVQQRIFFDGAYERPLLDWLRQTLRPGDVFWDVGANIGAVTIVAARLGARVVAFEPDPRSRDWLERNLRANRLPEVLVVPEALGDRDGTADLFQADRHNTGLTSLSATRARSAASVRATVARADGFAARHPDLMPDVIKIDVEGSEALVLDGAPEVLRSPSLRAVVFEDRVGADGGPACREAVACLEAAGFAVEPFARSDAHAEDGQSNFLARRRGSSR